VEVATAVAAAAVTCGLCGLAAAVVLGVEVNWEKPQLPASLGPCKSVAEEVDVGVGGKR
jgi:hypothetical protein